MTKKKLAPAKAKPEKSKHDGKNKDESGLTPMQELFVREYLIDKNGTAAAKRAGFSASHASSQAYQLLQKTPVKKAINEAISAQYRRLDITADRILHELMLLATVDIAAAYDKHGALLRVNEMPEEIRRAIAGVEVFEEFEMNNGVKEKIGETSKLKLIDKKGALDTLARHLKLLTDKLEVTDKTGLAQKLARARARREAK